MHNNIPLKEAFNSKFEGIVLKYYFTNNRKNCVQS